MLRIFDGTTRTCAGVTRRELLRVGGLACGGLSLSTLLASRAAGAESFLRDRSVVLLFLQGGPAHIEFFDPKMTAPVEIRSITGEVATRLPGVTFGGTFPKLAQLADKLTVVRSYGSKNAGHTYQDVASGRNPTKATMGAIHARIAGRNHPRTGMPTNTLVLPEAIDGDLELGKNFETNALPTLTAAGDFGPSYAAFDPSGGGPIRESMDLRLPAARFDDRRTLLASLDRYRRHAETSGWLDSVDKYRAQAFDVIARGVGSAFDLSNEDPRTIAKYDTSSYFKNSDIQRYYDMRRATNLLGKQMLLARRLCEAGCGFVTVSDCGWDMHANNNSPKGMQGIYPMGSQVDHAVAAFIEDVEARGLSDKILLVVTGEMGRTPRINKNGGRDHYGELTSLLLYGGGLKMGQVVGASDRTASRPQTRPYLPKNLFATVMHTLYDVGTLRLAPDVPRDLLKALEDAERIDEVA